MARRARRFARDLGMALRLPRTATAIVDLLVRTSRRLSVREIVERVQMSERSVRGSLSLLIRRGVLERHGIVTAKNRLAYLYHLRPRDELVRVVHDHFSKTLATLRRAAPRRLSPRSAGSERS
ncbi:MAG: hypothetical protein HY557_08835 [Euryarchaeota archaeon]|nr:hypothetical protein [Euryarchaeota archaeon]